MAHSVDQNPLANTIPLKYAITRVHTDNQPNNAFINFLKNKKPTQWWALMMYGTADRTRTGTPKDGRF